MADGIRDWPTFPMVLVAHTFLKVAAPVREAFKMQTRYKCKKTYTCRYGNPTIQLGARIHVLERVMCVPQCILRVLRRVLHVLRNMS